MQTSEARLGDNAVRNREALCISRLPFVFLVAARVQIMYFRSGSGTLIRTGSTTVLTDCEQEGENCSRAANAFVCRTYS